MFAKYCIFSDGADNCLARVLFNFCCLNCHWFLYLLADRRGETVGTKPFLLLFKYKIKIWIETAALTRNRPCNVVWRPKFYIKLLLIDTHPLHQAILQNILRKLLSYYIKLLLLDTHPLHTWKAILQNILRKLLSYYIYQITSIRYTSSSYMEAILPNILRKTFELLRKFKAI